VIIYLKPGKAADVLMKREKRIKAPKPVSPPCPKWY
jgi:hypothetical protein